MKKLVSVLLISLLSLTLNTAAFALAEQTDKGSAQFDKVNINNATLKQLIKLPGIGRSKAKAILAHREEYGQIANAEELLLVPGIGKKALKRLENKIRYK